MLIFWQLFKVLSQNQQIISTTWIYLLIDVSLLSDGLSIISIELVA